MPFLLKQNSSHSSIELKIIIIMIIKIHKKKKLLKNKFFKGEFDKSVSIFFVMVSANFSLSSIYIRRKYWIRENFRFPVFDEFTCFEMS